MITKFNQYNGLFSVDLDGENMIFRLSYDENKEPFRVYLLLDSDIYAELSIIVPDSDELDKGEFFIDSKIDYRIIEELINQGFIIETNKETKAGENVVKSYKINI